MKQENNEETKSTDETSWSKIIQERQKIKKVSKQLQKEVNARKSNILDKIDKRSDESKSNLQKVIHQLELAAQDGDKEKLKELLQNML